MEPLDVSVQELAMNVGMMLLIGYLMMFAVVWIVRFLRGAVIT